MGFGILCIVYSDMYMMYRAKETYCSTVGSKICVIVGMLMNGYADKLTLNVRSLIVGTA